LAEVTNENILLKDLILNTILFAEDQMTVAVTEDKLQTEVYALNSATKYNLKISVNKI
jgi:hypothetical protein